jgi:flagellar basal-body rod protein FlgG
MAMIRAFSTSATGMNAQQLVLDNTANNLANVNTTAFKTSKVEFQDLLYTTLRQPGTQATQNQQLPTGLQIGNGVQVAGNTKIFTTGPLVSTGNPLNVAIEGDGFFQIAPPSGGGGGQTNLYTRDGSFSLNSNRQLVTADGYFLLPQLTIPQDATTVSIGADGTVSVVTASSPNTSTTVGQLQLARFPNPAGLSSNSQNLYQQTPASGTVTLQTPGQNGTGQLQSGYLEQSNVDVVGELVNLIQAQRAYEFNTKAITVADQMLSDTNDLVR